MSAITDRPKVTIIDMWPLESNCCICDKDLFGCKTGIPMYEGDCVPHTWKGEWGGFDACEECFDRYEGIQGQFLEPFYMPKQRERVI